MELKTPEEFAKLYNTQIKTGELQNYLLGIEYPNQKLLKLLNSECIKIAADLGGGYFTDAHWLNEPLATGSAYHLYCMQIVKE